MEFNILALTSAIAHAGLIWYGKWQDDHAMVKYTDIDYWVLADAARAVYNLKSPYTRATYRYTPILAWLLLPNEIFGEWYGKALFSGFDLVASFFIYSLLRAQMVTKRSAVVITAILYALNPIVLIVSTRGNAESIICTLCLAFIWTLAKGRRLTSAVILGLAIHVKIFPLIYLPTVLVFMGLFPNTSFATSRSVQTPQTPVKDFKSPCPSAIQGTPVKGQQLTGRQKMIDLKWKHVQYVLTVFLTVTVLTGMTYILYGKQAIDESIIYHLTRRDHRHNFSPYWLMFYHNVSLKWPDWILSLIPFIPQALLALTIALVYGRRDFCFAIFLQTFLFVSLNKYFLWYLSILPVCLPSLKRARWDEIIAMIGLWAGSQALFLANAYKLEFKGEPVHIQTWIGSLCFMLSNVWIASRLIAINKRSRTSLPVK